MNYTFNKERLWLQIIEKNTFLVLLNFWKNGGEKGFSEEKCNELYTIGLLHDIGYAFLEEKDFIKHNVVGGEVLRKQGYKFWKEIYYHGVVNSPYQSEYLDLLNLADMHIDSEGKYVTLDGRLEELSERYNVEIEKLDSYPMIQELKQKGFD